MSLLRPLDPNFPIERQLGIESIEKRRKQPVRGLRISDRDGRGVCQTLLHERHAVTGNRISMLLVRVA